MELRLYTSVRRLKTVDTYQLRTAITTVPCLASGMAKISRFDVSLYKVRAGKDAELCPATIRYKRCKSDVCTAYVTKAAVSTVSVNTGKDTGDAYDTYRIEALIDNKLVAELSIPVTLDGVRGNTGPLVFPAGIYDSKTRYTCTDKSTVMVLDGENYYVLELKGTVVGLDPSDDYATNGAEAHWQFVEKVEYAFFNVVMANFAKLASAVFHGDYMFSQQGKDAAGKATNDYSKFGTDAFTPNLLLNFLTGEMRTNSGIFKGSMATPFGLGVISSTDRKLDFTTGFNFQYEGGGDIYLPNEEIYDGIECSLFSRYPQTSFNVKIAGNDGFIDKDHTMNSVFGYSKIVVSGKMLRLKAIKHTQKVFWYILNMGDFSQDELIH